MIEAAGHKVETTGRGYAVDGVLRVDQVAGGRWVACDHYGNAIGDNIELAKHLAGEDLPFAEAVFRVTGGGATVSRDVRPAEPLAPPTLPAPSPAAREKGRRYLESRAISAETVDRAEKAGMLAYADGAVMFVGRNAGSVRCATARATSPTAAVQKRDLKGSDKTFAPILPGNPKSVHIVEGGVDALALHDLARMTGQEPPTVIVSGGAGVRRFVQNEAIQRILAGAERVTVWRDTEDTPEKQEKTNAAHTKQAEAIRAVTGAVVTERDPPGACKDVAEHLAAERQRVEIERRAAEAAERLAVKPARASRRDDGPSLPTPAPR